MTASPFVLATDLDGTFLGGSDHDRANLYARFRPPRTGMVLVFVTGRDLDFVRTIVEAGLVPAPDYVVGDVGTSVVDHRFEHVDAVQAGIDAVWKDRSADILALLKDEPGIVLQPGDWLSRRRVSYYYTPGSLRADTIAKVEATGCDWITSADRFFDVMPKGISKGPTLRRLVAHLGWDPQRVLAAGDTLNDRSLLLEGFPAVAVGNSEPELLQLVQGASTVYCAAQPGTGGITEAMHHFDVPGIP